MKRITEKVYPNIFLEYETVSRWTNLSNVLVKQWYELISFTPKNAKASYLLK